MAMQRGDDLVDEVVRDCAEVDEMLAKGVKTIAKAFVFFIGGGLFFMVATSAFYIPLAFVLFGVQIASIYVAVQCRPLLVWYLVGDTAETRTPIVSIIASVAVYIMQVGMGVCGVLALWNWRTEGAYRIAALFLGLSVYALYRMRSVRISLRRARVVLTADRFVVHGADGSVCDMRWEDSPRLVGIDRVGMGVFEDAGGVRQRVALVSLPLKRVELRDIVEFYASHPHERARIASSDGLQQLCRLCAITPAGR
ncbi:hypothetical protein [Schaalia suimastitidis]|uniref:hypothetical protein n=1 Tax=Schaalia suimastitidis TaxID=121163 RepID=UPI000411EF11|nr:hypothetical protein [Schaalia suimastitidis]